MTHTRRLWGRLTLILACALAGSLQAQTGTVTGRVTEAASRTALDGVTVSVVGTDLSTQTERGGEYVLRGVPTGQQELRFSYLGFDPQTATVTVGSGETALQNLVMTGEVFELEAFEVNSQILGQARALNFQKNAVGTANVVSADAIGRFPDQNAAEALNRLPGVSVERDQGEGRFVVIRGINPNLNSVAIDGVALASPSAGERATLLDTIPSDTLQRLEVYKSVLPDQPGDAVGGYINIKTPSAFDQEEMVGRLSLQGNYSELVEEWEGKFSGAWGDTFADGTIGLILNASYEERTFGSDNQEADPWEEEDGEDGSSGLVSGEFQFREYDLTRTRTGLSANLEFKPTTDAYYFIRGSWNEYQDVEIRHAGVLENEAFTAIGDTAFETTESVVIREMKDREENMRIFALSAGGENVWDSVTLDYKVSLSTAEEDTPYDFETIYELSDAAELRFTNTGGYHPRVAQIDGPSIYDAANYEFDGIEDANQLVEEDDLSGEINLRVDVENDFMRFFKTGVLLRNKEKDSDLEVFESDDNPSSVDTLDLVQYGSPRDPYNTGLPYVDPGFRKQFLEDEAAYAMERADGDSAIEDFTSEEDVFATYLMGNFNLGGGQLVVGGRYEHTDFSTSGFEYNDDTGDINRTRQSNDYGHFLPGVHYRAELAEDLVLRLSWNNTLSRPSFEQTIPGAEIEGDEVTVGNPQLDALESMNFDASLEYYLPPLGILSVSVFYKDIENFIYEQTLIQDFGDISDAEVTTFRNGPSGDILGVELAAQQQLSFLPAPFTGLGIYANVTFTDSSADVLGAEEGDPLRELSFIKQSDMVGNLALTWEYSGFFFRVAGTYRDEYLDEVGGEALEDRYIDEHLQVDFSGHYQITENWRIFANWLNITDEPLRARFGETGRLSQFEEYGWSANVGVRWNY